MQGYFNLLIQGRQIYLKGYPSSCQMVKPGHAAVQEASVGGGVGLTDALAVIALMSQTILHGAHEQLQLVYLWFCI